MFENMNKCNAHINPSPYIMSHISVLQKPILICNFSVSWLYNSYNECCQSLIVTLHIRKTKRSIRKIPCAIFFWLLFSYIVLRHTQHFIILLNFIRLCAHIWNVDTYVHFCTLTHIYICLMTSFLHCDLIVRVIYVLFSYFYVFY